MQKRDPQSTSSGMCWQEHPASQVTISPVMFPPPPHRGSSLVPQKNLVLLATSISCSSTLVVICSQRVLKMSAFLIVGGKLSYFLLASVTMTLRSEST